jgi:hypothetical protein
MMQDDLHSIEPGMEVYDSTGHEVGTIAFIFRQLHLPPSGAEPDTALIEEDMAEIKTTGFLGLGAHLHVHLSDVEQIRGGTVFLARSLAALKESEQHDTPVPPGEPH